MLIEHLDQAITTERRRELTSTHGIPESYAEEALAKLLGLAPKLKFRDIFIQNVLISKRLTSFRQKVPTHDQNRYLSLNLINERLFV
ncbi:MAG: hypothetical protein ACK481_11525 [Candidatus Melainabacteria bacterium]